MTSKERVLMALKGEEVDRVPVSAWMHFPFDDTTYDGQVRAFVDFQKTYNWDFMKLMYRNTFNLQDWGCTFGDYHPVFGYWLHTGYPIKDCDHWAKLKPLAPDVGALGEMVRVTSAVAGEISPDVLKLATVFSPVMVANQLAGQERICTDMREHPELVHAGLEVITKTVIDFALACLKNGADGIFFATGEARKGFMSISEYREFGHPYSLRVLKAISDSSMMTMMHICGEDIYFDEFLNYSVHCYNWDDHYGAPSLADARKKTGRCLIGGIDKTGVLFNGSPEDVKNEAHNAISSVGRKGFILAPGCGIPFATPKANLKALRDSVEG